MVRRRTSACSGAWPRSCPAAGRTARMCGAAARRASATLCCTPALLHEARNSPSAWMGLAGLLPTRVSMPAAIFVRSSATAAVRFRTLPVMPNLSCTPGEPGADSAWNILMAISPSPSGTKGRSGCGASAIAFASNLFITRARAEEGAVWQRSGGLDSRSVDAKAKEVARRRAAPCSLRAYTFDYRPLFQDEEAIYAAQAAQMLSIPLRRVSVAEAVPYVRWDNPCIRQPEPAHEPFLDLHHDHLSEAAGHHRVLLTGEGGDPSLLGETWPYLVSLFRRLPWIPLFLALRSYCLSHRRIPPLLGGFRMRLRRGFHRQDLFADYPPWLNPELERRLKLRDRWPELQRA